MFNQILDDPTKTQRSQSITLCVLSAFVGSYLKTILVMRFCIRMSQAFTRRHYIPDQLFQFLYLGKATILFPVENFFAVNTNMKIAIYFAGL